ncbi:Suppressor of organelle fusion 1 [Aphelenchoides fujianensis]|nr:Suppressor of organelle fusion 1 [Aphelenchoides fujianensis]
MHGGSAHIIESTNELIKQYLASYRFYNTLAAADRDEQFERDFRVQVDRIVKGIAEFIDTFELDALMAIYEFFNTKLFNNLDEKKQLEKCTYFYERMSPIICNNPHWNEWYALPYIPNASSQEPYRSYFSKQWHELLLVSLHNFIVNRIDKLVKPPLVNLNLEGDDGRERGWTNGHLALRHSVAAQLMDDFAIIAQQRSEVRSTQSKASLKSVLRNITGRRSED